MLTALMFSGNFINQFLGNSCFPGVKHLQIPCHLLELTCYPPLMGNQWEGSVIVGRVLGPRKVMPSKCKNLLSW